MLLNMVMFKVTICDFGKMNINMTDNLATLYGVETKRLNEQVKRNIRLQDTFGRENVVSVVLHMDEHTPHKVFSDSTKPKSICCYKAYSLLALPNG